MFARPALHKAPFVAGSLVLEIENAQKVGADLDEVAFAKPRGLDRCHKRESYPTSRRRVKHATMPKSSMKRASIGIALLVAGFIAGLVLTAAFERQKSPRRRPKPHDNKPSRRQRQRRHSSGVAPRSHGDCGAGHEGRRQHLIGPGRSTPNSPFANDPFFQYFFGGREDMFGSRDQLARSLGSGVLISDDGYVVTNSHVIGGANAEITVVFGDRHEAPARIVGIDKATDLALVQGAKPSRPR
jgi:S1-C subfamily serine protease